MENSKKIAKKLKKLKKKTIMALFQAKIGWKMLRKRETKNYSSVTFPPTRNRKFEKKIAK